MMDVVTSQAINTLLRVIKEYPKDKQLVDWPIQIYNIDEIGMASEHHRTKTVTLKRQKIWNAAPLEIRLKQL